MSEARRTSARLRPLLRLGRAALVGACLLCVVPSGTLAAEPTIEATGTSLANYAWTPSSAEIDSGESATFKNTTGISHALGWESGPETPDCTGLPVGGQGNWSGSCSFALGGTYGFYCPLHPAQMQGTIVVNGPAAPVAVTLPASGVTETGATLNATVNPSGQASTYYFEYGTTAAYGQQTTETSAGEGTASVSKAETVAGLSPATTYHFRIVAKNATGTSFGIDRTFLTPGPPDATTAAATGVGSVEATLAGSVNPHGFATSYYFDYGVTTAYGQKTADKAAGSGSAAVSVSALLSGLSPGTTYHYRLVAKSTAGTTTGADRTFTTALVPPVGQEPPSDSSAAGPLPQPSSVTGVSSPPETRLTLKPRARTRDSTPTLRFTAAVAGATFRCSVDGKPFKPCRSPFTAPPLKPGRHSIRVAAVVAGLADPTPATAAFKVLAKRR